MRARMSAVAILFVAALMVAPATGVDAQTPVKLTFYYPVQVAGPLAKLMDDLVNEFNAMQTGIQVEPVYAGNYYQTMQRTQTSVMGRTPPDVAVLLVIDYLTLRRMNAIHPLDEYIAREGGQAFLQDFHPAWLDGAVVDGRVWSLPFQRSTPIFYYNVDHFQRAGLDPSRPPQNWDELLAYAQKLTLRDAAGNIVQWGVGMPTESWFLQAFAMQNEGILSSADGTDVYFNSEPVVQVVQYWVDLVNEYKVMPQHKGYGDLSSDFVAGNLSMMFNSSGSLRFVRDFAKFPFETAFLPGHKKQAIPLGGGNLYIFRDIPQARRDAAWEFVKFMTSTETMAQWSVGSGYIAVRESSFQVPVLRDYLESFPQAQVAKEQIPLGSAEWAVYNIPQIRAILEPAIAEAISLKLTPQQAMDKAQREAAAVLRAFK